MRIAFAVIDEIPDGGAVAHRVQMLAGGLASLGHEVHIIAPYKFSPGPLAQESNGVKLHWGAHLEKSRSYAGVARFRKRYLMYKTSYQLLMKKLDWLILYEMGLESLPFLLIAKLAGTKVAVDNCDIRLMSDYKTLRGIIRFINYEVGYLLVSPRLDLNFTISTYLEKLLRLKAPGVPLVSVLAPVDMAKFRKRRHSSKAFKDRLGLRGVSVIGYFGSIHAAKGLETLLKAAHKLLTSGKAFKLLISGNTAKNAYLLRRIEELGLSDHVVLTGYLSTDELITAMSVPDILVEPKIEHEQNRAAFPQKLAEYLAMGTPIVASAIGDIPLFLHDQENALLCQPGDPDSLAAALLRLMEDDNLKERLSQKARETAGRYFDCRIIAKQIEAAL